MHHKLISQFLHIDDKVFQSFVPGVNKIAIVT